MNYHSNLTLKVLRSSSAGNCYFLESNDEILILECGIPVKEIKKALGFTFKKVQGCLVTHSHNDHSKALKDLLACGVKCFALPETFESKGLKSPFRKDIKELQNINIGNFKVKVLPAKHDVPIVSFLIDYMGVQTVFITDSYYLPYEIKGVHNWLIEANYDKEVLTNKVLDGKLNQFLAKRVIQSHLSIDKVLEILKENDKYTRNIVLIHLSDSNSDIESFRIRVQERTGKPTYIADKGLEVCI